MPRETLTTSQRRTIFGRRRVTPHVFIADDSPHVCSFLPAMFRDMGFVVHEAAGPAERDPTASLTFPIDAMDLAVIGVSTESTTAPTMLELLRTGRDPTAPPVCRKLPSISRKRLPIIGWNYGTSPNSTRDH